jgi:hypothetical protein
VSGVFLSLKGEIIANNSYVGIDDIGEDDDALLCHTNKTDCCHESYNRAGEWYFPNGMIVKIEGRSADEFYRDRRAQVVRLNRRQGTFTVRGLFRCEVPDANNKWQTIYVNIGK